VWPTKFIYPEMDHPVHTLKSFFFNMHGNISHLYQDHQCVSVCMCTHTFAWSCYICSAVTMHWVESCAVVFSMYWTKLV